MKKDLYVYEKDGQYYLSYLVKASVQNQHQATGIILLMQQMAMRSINIMRSIILLVLDMVF